MLEDGRTFRGDAYGARGATFGEAVFTTGMTGYQETLTDPSYHRQVVVQTAPHIGNTGMNDEDPESRRIWVAGYVVRDPAPRASNWRSAARTGRRPARWPGSWASRHRHPRAHPAPARARRHARRGLLRRLDRSAPTCSLERVLASPQHGGRRPHRRRHDRASRTSSSPKGGHRFTVAAVDLGIKAMTPRRMAERGIRVIVLPATVSRRSTWPTPMPTASSCRNGPGDPATADHAVELVRAVLAADRPLFGICFGNQVLGRALGLDTYKLKFGHAASTSRSGTTPRARSRSPRTTTGSP